MSSATLYPQLIVGSERLNLDSSSDATQLCLAVTMSIIGTSYEGVGHAYLGIPLLLITTLAAFGLLMASLAASQRKKLLRIALLSVGVVVFQYYVFCLGMGEKGWFALSNTRTAGYAEFERLFFFVCLGCSLLTIGKLFIIPKDEEQT